VAPTLPPFPPLPTPLGDLPLKQTPFCLFGSDVMSRIRAALDGSDLTTPIRAALGQVVARLAGGRCDQISEVLLVGNTVRHPERINLVSLVEVVRERQEALRVRGSLRDGPSLDESNMLGAVADWGREGHGA
jgi:hypothetical protein